MNEETNLENFHHSVQNVVDVYKKLQSISIDEPLDGDAVDILVKRIKNIINDDQGNS